MRRRKTAREGIGSLVMLCALTSCAALQGTRAPEYAAITLPFDSAPYDSIAVTFVNSSNQWLPADAEQAAQSRVKQRLDERGYAAKMRNATRSYGPRTRRTASPPTPESGSNGAGWAPGGALTSDAARDIAMEMGVPAVLVFDVIDVRTELRSDTVDSVQCPPGVWRGRVNPPAITRVPERCSQSEWAVTPARPGDPVGTRRTGVSVYAWLIDRKTGAVVWARRVGGWGIGLDDAVSTLLESLPSHAKPNQ